MDMLSLLNLLFIAIYAVLLGLVAPYVGLASEHYGSYVPTALAVVSGSVLWMLGTWSGLHYDQAWMDEAMAQLSPEGLSTLAFIRAIYAAEYGPLNAMYRARHGVDLPQNANYAPVTVAPAQAKAGEMIDPVGGGTTTGSILTPGSLRTRSRTAIAEPDFKDALQVMLAHNKQMQHEMQWVLCKKCYQRE